MPHFVIKTHEFLADLETPVSLYLKLSRRSDSSFLLESVEQGETLGRYSFLGFDPEAVFELYPNHWKVKPKKGAVKKIRFKDPLDLLRQELREGKGLESGRDYPKFLGGLVGFFSYEAVQYFESIKFRAKREASKIPLAVFFKVHQFVLFDHIERKMKFVALYPRNMKTRKMESAFRKNIEDIEKKLNLPLPKALKKGKVSKHLKSNMTPAQFRKSVNRIKEYIKEGDIIQAVFSQRFDLGSMTSGIDFYRILRSLNPSPYMFFFKYRDLELAGSSPELLVRKKGSHAEVRPIAGTRPRGKSEAEDLKFESQLRRSVKERAEHLMLVDLARNDVGRVCEHASVKVRQFERVERYSHVMHLVSDVEGRLLKKHGALDLLRSTFPAGTLSGAPKIRAMEIIDEQEPTPRGPYGGSLGYISYNDDMDMCITIRTLINQRGQASVQAGAGIVFDSNPAKEFRETQNKAMALFKAFQQAEHHEI